MGTGAELAIPAIIAAVGAGASYANTKRTERKQDNALADKIRNQRRTQGEIDNKVNELVTKTGESDPKASITQAQQGYMQQLLAGKAQANSGLGNVAGASDAYQKDSANAALGIANDGKDLASLFARIDAPAAQRRQEGTDAIRASQGIDMLRRNAGGDAYLDDLRLGAIRRNPLLDAVAAAASSYGQSGGASMGMGGMTPVDPGAVNPGQVAMPNLSEIYGAPKSAPTKKTKKKAA